MLRKNTSGQFIHFAGIVASTGAALTGATFAYRRCIDGTFAAGGGTITEDSAVNGFYKCALAQADTNGNDLGFFFTASTAVPVAINAITTAADPTDGVHFGLTSLPNTAVTTNASLLTSGTGTDQILVASGKVVTPDTQKVDVNTIKTNPVANGGTVTFPTNATLASTTNITGGTITTVTTVTNPVAVTSNIKTNQALAAIPLFMIDSDGNPLTGLSVTVTRSIDGGGFGAGTLGAVTEVGGGFYKFDAAAGDMNGKVIDFIGVAVGAADCPLTIVTSP